MTTSIPKVVGVLVAYNTSGELLLRTVKRLSLQLSSLLVMDNSDGSSSAKDVLANSAVHNVEYHSLNGNIGIAAAQNAGISRAKELGAEFVLFLDDDSNFPDGGVEGLLAELEAERRTLPRTVAIGPRVVDERTGQALVAVWERGRVVPGQVVRTTEVAYLVSSGALVDIDAFVKYGSFRGDYFIDHVDKEWGFRVGLQGGRLVITALVTMTHQLGDDPTTSRNGSIRYRHVSPARDYYLTRNAILLMRDLPLPPRKYVDLLRLLTESSIRKIFGRGRTVAQRLAVIRGLGHGIINRRGPLSR